MDGFNDLQRLDDEIEADKRAVEGLREKVSALPYDHPIWSQIAELIADELTNQVAPMSKCTHETSEVIFMFEGFSVLLCTWECGEPLIELDLENHHVVTYTAAELVTMKQRMTKAKAALEAINAFQSDDNGYVRRGVLDIAAAALAELDA